MQRRSFLGMLATAASLGLMQIGAPVRSALAQTPTGPPRPSTTPPGRWEVFAGGRDAPGELLSESGVAIDARGTIYVGDLSNNRVQKFTMDGAPAGSFPIWPGWVGRLPSIVDLALTPSGEMFLLFGSALAFEGQELYYGVRYAASGAPISQFGPHGDAPHGLDRPTGLDVAADGAVWITDARRHRVVAYGRNGQWLRSIGGEGSEPGQFRGPVGVAVAPNGLLWVTDSGNNRVQALTQAGAPVRVWDTAGAEWGQFSGVQRIRVGRDGNVVVSESRLSYSGRPNTAPENRRIQKLTPDGTPLASAWLYEVTALAVGPDGSVATISRAVPSGVHLFSPSLDPLGRLGVFAPDDAPPAPDRLVTPHSIATDAQGNVYIADTKQVAIFKYAPDGTLLTRWGAAGDELGQMREPAAILVTPDGSIYVSDQALDRVYKLSPDWQVLDVWGGAGAGPGRFNLPHALAADAQGNIYVADGSNQRIQKFSPSGELLAIMRNSFTQEARTTNVPTDGVAVDAQGRVYSYGSRQHTVYRMLADGTYDRRIATFETEPHGLAVAPDGTLWVTEYRGNRVWQLDLEGQPLAVWGTQLQGPGQYLAGQPDFSMPTGFAFDQAGRVYVSSDGQGRVWRFTPEGVR